MQNFKSKINQFIRNTTRRISCDNSVIPVPDGELILNRAVIIRVSQGLANQMICYKAGRMVALANNAPLVLDNRFYGHLKKESNRNYQLHHFPIQADLSIFSDSAMENILFNNAVSMISRDDLSSFSIAELPGLFQLTDNKPILYFDFWGALHLRDLADQYFSEKGFLRELILNKDRGLEDRDKILLRRIESTRNPVAIHVRRGDYASHDGGLLVSKNYYNLSIQKMEERLESPDFFVFSDDQQWCKKNLVARTPLHHIDWNNDSTGYRDLFLASQCRHFILSNESTFSHLIVQLSIKDEGRIVITSTKSDIVGNNH